VLVGGVEEYMRIAIAEARTSLREGNHGFGAVVLAHGPYSEFCAESIRLRPASGKPSSHR
jgi:tRNA(Arg) A34 adenosine deaminase TadA